MGGDKTEAKESDSPSVSVGGPELRPQSPLGLTVTLSESPCHPHVGTPARASSTPLPWTGFPTESVKRAGRGTVSEKQGGGVFKGRFNHKVRSWRHTVAAPVVFEKWFRIKAKASHRASHPLE